MKGVAVPVIGDDNNLSIPPNERKNGIVAYKKDHPASKCTDSYIIKKAGILKESEPLLPELYPVFRELVLNQLFL